MQRSLVPAKVGISLGLGIGLGLLGIYAYSSKHASSQEALSVDIQSVDVQSVDVQTVDVQTVDVQTVDIQSADLEIQSERPLSLVNPSSATQPSDLAPLTPSSLSRAKDYSKPQDSFIAYPDPSLDESGAVTVAAKIGTKIGTMGRSKQVTPASVPAESVMGDRMIEVRTTPNSAIEAAIATAIPGVATCPYSSGMPSESSSSDHDSSHAGAMGEHHYFYHAVDLNDDVVDEIVVQVRGPMTCGTGGCSTLILQSQHQDSSSVGPYDVLSHLTLVNPPIIVSDRTSSGWHDLLIDVSGGGTVAGYRQLKFDGRSYPTNPSIEPMATRSDIDPSNGTILRVDDANMGAIAPVVSSPDCES